MALYRATVPFSTPSGEGAEFSFWFVASSTTLADTAVAAWFSSLSGSTPFKSVFPTAVTFATATVSQVDMATGVVISTSLAGGSFAATGGTNALPGQCAIVVSLRSALAGRSFRGRLFLPGPVNGMTATTGRLTTSAAGIVVLAMANAFRALNTALSTSMAVVYSRTLRSAIEIASVDVGDVIDTQRRRRDSLIEIRQSVTL